MAASYVKQQNRLNTSAELESRKVRKKTTVVSNKRIDGSHANCDGAGRVYGASISPSPNSDFCKLASAFAVLLLHLFARNSIEEGKKTMKNRNSDDACVKCNFRPNQGQDADGLRSSRLN